MRYRGSVSVVLEIDVDIDTEGMETWVDVQMAALGVLKAQLASTDPPVEWLSMAYPMIEAVGEVV